MATISSVMLNRISALEIITKETVSLRLGETNQSIPCDVRLGPGEVVFGFSWHRDTHSPDDAVVKEFKGKEQKVGNYSLMYSLSSDRSLVLKQPVQISDEGQYFCRVILSGAQAERFSNASTIHVLSAPREPFPSIVECARSEEGDEESGACLIEEAAGRSLNITCEVDGFRPLVKLSWWNGTHEMTDAHRTLTNKSDGTQSMSVTLEVTASLSTRRFICNVSGDAVGGYRLTEIQVAGTEVGGSPLVVIIVIVIALLVVLLVLLIAIVLILKSRRRSKRRARSSPEELSDMQQGAGVGEAEENYYVLELIVVVPTEEPPEEEEEEAPTLSEGKQTVNIPEPEIVVENNEESSERKSTCSGEEQEQTEELLQTQSSPRAETLERSRQFEASTVSQGWVFVEDEPKDVPTVSPPQPRPGPLNSILQGLGNLFDTVHNFVRHEA
ncbi:uncharacterized protein [Diadema antillarum]|uniref:uncharacterized protein n=1 Tax=Diadema antillarum TaxID=105358 RepID=UPI003A8701B8